MTQLIQTFNIDVNAFEKSARCSGVLVVTELVGGGGGPSVFKVSITRVTPVP